MTASSLRIIVTGLMAHFPMGGMTWHYLQYVLGLSRLGHDVMYLEDTGDWAYGPGVHASSADGSVNVQYLSRVMAHFGMSERWACRVVGERWYGLSERERSARLRSADLLINVSGSLPFVSDYRHIPRLAFVDTDPVFNQIKLANGDEQFRRQVAAHDVLFSFGESLRGALSPSGHRWLATRQPIVLVEWHPATSWRDVFTTVMNWMAKRTPRIREGQAYGQKNMELPRFLDLPRLVAPTVVELALNMGRDCEAPRDLLTRHGWRVVDPEVVCLDFNSYRAYIESSQAEWSVAKHGYVQGCSGWFSERSACYLAAGRPVVVQDTGFSAILPVGQGLFAFSTLEEAATAVHEVVSNYPRHARAARAMAEAYFDSDTVLTRLIEEAFRA
jgi:hypothetical protein